MATSFETHDAMVAAASEQRRVRRGSGFGFAQWDRAAARFRADPRRELSADAAAIAAYVQPGDVFMDVGGGAGRYSLPIALKCRESICVDPSPGMVVFEIVGVSEELAREAFRLAAAKLPLRTTFVSRMIGA
jgi:ubiquinone/menaquinone biosynthesis C-methylase UbiE